MIFDKVVLEFKELVQKLTQPRRLSLAADYLLIWRWRTCYQVVHAGGKMRHYAFLFSDFFWLFQEAIVTYFSRKEHFDAWAVWCESRWRRFIFQLPFFETEYQASRTDALGMCYPLFHVACCISLQLSLPQGTEYTWHPYPWQSLASAALNLSLSSVVIKFLTMSILQIF